MVKRIVRAALYLGYLLVIVSAVFYFGFWTGYRDTLLQAEDRDGIADRLEPPRHIDSATMLLLGSVEQGKVSSFINFETEKPAGNTRVCALGDSHTQGDEVGDRHDYPSYLQRIFTQRGFEQVEVLNFGNGWYGFSQIYVMWKNVARQFDCDFVLLLPLEFWYARDSTFNHTRGLFPSYLHARLVLEKGDLRLVAPIGETAEQRLQGYVRPVPHWQYLRYDSQPPNILDAPFQGRRKLRNRFYYSRQSRAEEAVDIYSKVIRAIADDGPQLVVMFRGVNQSLYPKLISSQNRDIGAALLSETQTFPYVAPAKHESSWGQEVTAMAFFELLTGGSKTGFPLVTAEDISAATTGTPGALHDYREVWVEYRGERLRYFVNEVNKRHYDHGAHLGLFKQLGIAGLLSLATPGGAIADSCLLPLRDIPASDAELKFTSGMGDRDARSFGAVYQLQPDVAIFKATLPISINDSCSLIAGREETAEAIGDGTLMLNGKSVARFNGARIEPELGSMMKLRDSGEHLASIASLTTPGVIEIVLKKDDGTVIRRPLLTLQSQLSPEYLEVKQALENPIEMAPD